MVPNDTVVAVALIVAMIFPTATQSPPARAAQPIEPIGAISDAFRTPSSPWVRITAMGDLPVDWDAVRHSPPKPGEKRLLGQPVRDDALAGAMDRDRHAAGVIQRETLAKQRRALLIFGDMHVTHRPTSIVGRLESDAGVRVLNTARGGESRGTVLRPSGRFMMTRKQARRRAPVAGRPTR